MMPTPHVDLMERYSRGTQVADELGELTLMSVRARTEASSHSYMPNEFVKFRRCLLLLSMPFLG